MLHLVKRCTGAVRIRRHERHGISPEEQLSGSLRRSTIEPGETAEVDLKRNTPFCQPECQRRISLNFNVALWVGQNRLVPGGLQREKRVVSVVRPLLERQFHEDGLTFAQREGYPGCKLIRQIRAEEVLKAANDRDAEGSRQLEHLGVRLLDPIQICLVERRLEMRGRHDRVEAKRPPAAEHRIGLDP